MISAGDEYVADLRDDLLTRRSRLEDIYGAGLDLKTGEINFLPLINRRNPSTENGKISEDRAERIVTLVQYFFENIPCFKAARSLPRYSKKPRGFMS